MLADVLGVLGGPGSLEPGVPTGSAGRNTASGGGSSSVSNDSSIDISGNKKSTITLNQTDDSNLSGAAQDFGNVVNLKESDGAVVTLTDHGLVDKAFGFASEVSKHTQSLARAGIDAANIRATLPEERLGGSTVANIAPVAVALAFAVGIAFVLRS